MFSWKQVHLGLDIICQRSFENSYLELWFISALSQADGLGGPLAPQVCGPSVNPISTRGQILPTTVVRATPPGFSDLATALHIFCTKICLSWLGFVCYNTELHSDLTRLKKTGSFFYEIDVSFFILFHHARHLQQIHWYKIFCGMYGFAVMFIFFSISFFFLFSKCWRWNNWFRLCYGRSFYSYVKKCLHSSKISWIPIF